MFLRTAVTGLLGLLLGASALAADYATQRRAIDERIDALEADREGAAPAERLKHLIDLYFDYTMLEYPEFATYIGHPGDHGRWTDNSEAAVTRREQDTHRALAIIKTIDRERLHGVDRLNYDLLVEQLENNIEGERFGGNYLVLSQLHGPQQNIAQMMTMMPATNLAQYAHIVSRLQGASRVIDDAIAWMRAGLAKGVTPPRITLRDVPDQVANQIVEDPLQSPLLGSFSRFPEHIDGDTRARLTAQASQAYREGVKPAFERLHAFLVEEYLPGARETIAMKDLPDGQDWYAFNVRQSTTTDLSPGEIHEIGQAEVKRIRAEMDRVIEQSGFEGDFAAFTEFLRTDPQFYFTEPDALLAAYRDIAKRADPELVKLFGRLPRTPYGIVPVPAYAEKSQTTAYYQPGSLEAGRPGEFFANTYALDTRPKWEMEALTLHEAVPGHHLQIALQQELDDMAWFRRFGGYTAFTEGWGLYSESLGTEMGFYTDPYSKFGQLTYEIWRAIRLVVDTGMHALGWSRQQAIDYFTANSGKTGHDIVVEVDRYIVWPGQALAYKIGELKLKELRQRARERLGEDFDVRAFHDQVLGQGSLPLTVLEKHIDEWIAAQL